LFLRVFKAKDLKKTVQSEGNALKKNQDKTHGNASFDQKAKGYPAWVGRAFHDGPRRMGKFPGCKDQHDTPRDKEEEDPQKVGPSLCTGPHSLIDDVHAYMAVMEKGVPGAYEKNKTEQVPLQFLGKDKARVEEVTHDNVNKDHQNQPKGDPGNKSTNPFIQGVEDSTEILKSGDHKPASRKICKSVLVSLPIQHSP
jgi:hypothetical protein